MRVVTRDALNLSGTGWLPTLQRQRHRDSALSFLRDARPRTQG